jgi:mitochondrial translocator assembly and maintenance protein 41
VAFFRRPDTEAGCKLGQAPTQSPVPAPHFFLLSRSAWSNIIIIMISHCFTSSRPCCAGALRHDNGKTATAMMSSSSSSCSEGKKDEGGQPHDDDDEAELLGRHDDAGQLVSHAQLRDRLERALPLEHVVRAFGYGSGVFDQKLQKQKNTATHSSDINHPEEANDQQASWIKGGGRGVDDDDDDDDDGPLRGAVGASTSRSAARTDDNDEEEEKDDADDDDAPLVDMIVVVSDAATFHRQNVRKNPGHYPWGNRNIGRAEEDYDGVADRAAWIQRHAVPPFVQPWLTNPGAYYVIDNGAHKIKYGVVHMDDLRDDLCDWKYLYVAGRLHKPTVNVYSTPEGAEVEQAQHEHNLPSALRTALLILSGNTNNKGSAEVDELQVYETIAGLSYSGDFRMRFGAEDPHKIRNLVASSGSRVRFRHLYRSAAQQLERRGIVSIHPHEHASSNVMWTWDASDSALRALAEPLPARLRRAAVAGSAEGRGSASTNEVSLRIQDELRRIVAPAARYQSVKGLVTAGSVRTSITYALRKLRKGILKGR